MVLILIGFAFPMRSVLSMPRHKEGVSDYFEGAHNNTSHMNYAATLHVFQVSQEYCDNHDVKIYNATRGGMLEVFPRVDFGKLFI